MMQQMGGMGGMGGMGAMSGMGAMGGAGGAPPDLGVSGFVVIVFVDFVHGGAVNVCVDCWNAKQVTFYAAVQLCLALLELLTEIYILPMNNIGLYYTVYQGIINS